MDALPTVMRTVNWLGGMHGERAASLLLDVLPRSWVPTSGIRLVERGGLLWRLDLSDNLQRRLYLIGSYESLTLRAVLGRLRADDVVLDVGANIGALALPLAKRLQGGLVFAVEPAADTAERLRQHVAVNRLDHRVRVVDAALSNREGQAVLRVSEMGGGDVGTRTLEGTTPPVGAPVRLTTGDALRRDLRLTSFDVVKIDVEGHEMAVLDGLAGTLAQAPPRMIVLEVVPGNQHRAGASSQALLDRMTALGYRGWAIRHRGLTRVTPGFAGNVLFMPV